MNASYAALRHLAERMAADDVRGDLEPHLDPEVFARRKRFARFDEDDVRLLAELRGVFEKHADTVVARFYDHLRDFAPLRTLLADDASVERLKGFQRDYLLSLASGDYGNAYAAARLRIGRIHDRIGLEPEWYLGTYGLYFDLLFPLIQERFQDDAARGVAASASLAKLMVLDMQLVLDAYYRLREQKAVAASEHLAAVGEMAASIAHEVRNPLAGMKGALEVLRTELSANPANAEIADELLAQIVRLENLVRDLLNYARPRALDRTSIDLHEMLDRIVRMYADQADAAEITIHRSYGPGTGQVDADATQLEQVFLNLFHNALQAMEGRGGSLHVDTAARDGRIEIAFVDEGKGIDPGDMPKIFQPFFTTKHRGSGLGLSIVQKIIEAHAGELTIQSTPGRGTTARVILPSGGATDAR